MIAGKRYITDEMIATYHAERQRIKAVRPKGAETLEGGCLLYDLVSRPRERHRSARLEKGSDGRNRRVVVPLRG